jgi:hypothetical protein
MSDYDACDHIVRVLLEGCSKVSNYLQMISQIPFFILPFKPRIISKTVLFWVEMKVK